MDSQSNVTQCAVNFSVTAPPANLSVICASNKTVQCGSLWIFDLPIAFTTCCTQPPPVTVLSTVTNGACPQVLTRIWDITDACNNSLTCTQSVTVVDTTPPTTQCSGINLVPNGQFEFYTNCPSTSSQFP